eukprot:CAMPEP_0202968688 /NCGR_PEP_ID=MMETSP1396-20130829/14071_1 /ASSEMBLY_ACC=CAM_ASM_000872 /TAXON_ID= /ORGANISM="Pseudokeronopsis sp., Strain Brazil" /LENGTH=82 /DNA_ID=CAMNT_0049695263 /DNA_START=543 /DNA_END=791 /DNA_ORIENTATION=-
MRELVEARQVELDLFLDAGNYFLIPKTSGCMLKINKDESEELVSQFQFLRIDDEEEASEGFAYTLKDVFRKFDLQMNNELQY